MATNFDVVVIDTTASNGISLTITGGNTVSVSASTASNNGAGVVRGANSGVRISSGFIQADLDTFPNASYSSKGAVVTRNTTDRSVTADTTNVVPTQYYVQNEIARLDALIASGGGGGSIVGDFSYIPISSAITEDGPGGDPRGSGTIRYIPFSSFIM